MPNQSSTENMLHKLLFLKFGHKQKQMQLISIAPKGKSYGPKYNC